MENPPKKISNAGLIGQRGVNLVERIVLTMGCAWHPTGPLEAGIDGFIELRDPATSQALNLWIPVQVKSRSDLINESKDGFDFLCDARDIDYWLSGNAKVMLVICHPSTNEAYWVIVDDYLNTPEKRSTRRIHFDKHVNNFDEHSLHQLVNKATSLDAGIYLAPSPKPERLYSNLLKVEYISPAIFVADTQFRSPKEVWDKLNSIGGKYGPEWVLKNHRLWSFWDLREFPWSDLVDMGTVDELGTFEWAESDPPDTTRDLVQILNSTLKASLDKRLRYDKGFEYFYYPLPPESKGHVSRRYTRGGRLSALTVVETYTSRNDPSHTLYSRHMAFWSRFRHLDGKWYLEINPTYHFSWNGRPDLFYEEHLRRIKQIERQPRVFAEIHMWADFLREPPNLLQQRSEFLRFGSLLAMDVPVSIDDQAWLPKEDLSERATLRNQTAQLQLL